MVYGTTNLAKLEHMREMLAGLGLAVLGLDDISPGLPDVEETGQKPVDNARLKARHYHRLLGRPVFSCDSGLFIEGLSEEEQPGVMIRRVNGERMDDEAMLSHYAAIAERFGGRVKAQYINSICLVLNPDEVYCYQGPEISTDSFWLLATRHEQCIAGLPLDSLSQTLDGEQYFVELRHGESSMDVQMAQGFRRFFVESLGLDTRLVSLPQGSMKSAWAAE